MRNLIRFFSLIMVIALCMVPVMNSYAEAAADEAAAAEAVAVDTTAEAKASDVMLTVNGVAVTRGTANEIYQSLVSYYTGYGYDVSSEEATNLLWGIALKQAICLELINQKAAAEGLDQFTAEETEALKAQAAEELEGYVEQYITYYGGLSEDATEEEKLAARTNALSALESMGYTESALYDDLIENTVYDRVVSTVTQGIVVEDSEVTAAFDARVASDKEYYSDITMYEFYTNYYGMESYYQPEGYRGVTHILLTVDEELLNTYQSLQASLEEQASSESSEATETAEETAVPAEPTAVPVTEEEVEAARLACIASVQPTIDEINEKLAAGTSFEDLIAEYGTDPGMTNADNLANGYSVAQDSIVYDPVFVAAAFSVDNIGDISEPYVSSFGVHIVKYVRDVPAGPIEMTAEIAESLRAEVLSEKESEAFNSALVQWENEADIQMTEEAEQAIALTVTE